MCLQLCYKSENKIVILSKKLTPCLTSPFHAAEEYLTELAEETTPLPRIPCRGISKHWWWWSVSEYLFPSLINSLSTLCTSMNFDVALSIQVLCCSPLYSKGTMTKPMASGMARIKERIQMETISMAVIKGIPIPWTRLQEATALYLENNNKK